MIIVGRIDEVASRLVEKVKNFKGCLLGAFTHEILPRRRSLEKHRFLELSYGSRIGTYQESPKFIAPRHNGDTRTDALGASMR